MIGVGLETSATRVGVFDLDGHLLAESSRPVLIVYPAPGQAEQKGGLTGDGSAGGI